jgi:hypothetical protein
MIKYSKLYLTSLVCVILLVNLNYCKVKIIYIYYMADLEEVYDEFYEKLNNGGKLKNLVEIMNTPGFDVNYQNPKKWGNTPLMLAVTKDRQAVADELLHRGASLTNPNANLEDYPIVAARTGSVKIMKLFLILGIDVNQRNRQNRSLLNLAIGSGSEEMVNLLLSKGANIFQDDLNMAKGMNYEYGNDIIHILKSWPMAQVIPSSNEAARVRGQGTLDPEHLLDINDYLGEQGTHYGGRRKTSRRRNKSRKRNKTRRRNKSKRRNKRRL